MRKRKRLPEPLEEKESLLVRFEKAAAAFFFAVLLISVFLQVTTRFIPKIFGNEYMVSLPWTEELSRFSFIWLLMFGASIGLANQEHFKLTLIVQTLPDKLRRPLQIFIYLAELLFIYVLIRHGYPFSFLMWNQISPGLDVSYTFVYLSVPIGATFMAIHVLWRLARFVFGREETVYDKEEPS